LLHLLGRLLHIAVELLLFGGVGGLAHRLRRLRIDLLQPFGPVSHLLDEITGLLREVLLPLRDAIEFAALPLVEILHLLADGLLAEVARLLLKIGLVGGEALELLLHHPGVLISIEELDEIGEFIAHLLLDVDDLLLGRSVVVVGPLLVRLLAGLRLTLIVVALLLLIASLRLLLVPALRLLITALLRTLLIAALLGLLLVAPLRLLLSTLLRPLLIAALLIPALLGLLLVAALRLLTTLLWLLLLVLAALARRGIGAVALRLPVAAIGACLLGLRALLI